MGEQALFIPRWAVWAKVGFAVMVVLTLLALALAGLALWRDTRVLAAVLLVVALYLGATLVRSWRRAPYDGGVWLSPTSLSHRWGGRTWSVPWEDVVDADYAPNRDVSVRTNRRGQEQLTASMHLLVMAPGAVLALIDLYGNDADRRVELGTEKSLRDAEIAREAYAQGGFRPIIHNSLQVGRRRIFAASVTLAAAVLAIAALGRATTVDDDELAASLERQLTSKGIEATDVTCEGSIRKDVGETEECSFVVAGQRREVEVEVVAVDGDRISYRLTDR